VRRCGPDLCITHPNALPTGACASWFLMTELSFELVHGGGAGKFVFFLGARCLAAFHRMVSDEDERGAI